MLGVTATQTAEVLARLVAAYPRWSLSRETAAVYGDGLDGLDPRDCHEAVREWVKTQPKPPAVSELRAAALACRDRRAPTIPALSPPAGCTDHGRQQLANLGAWSRGEIDTATMIRDSAGIYASFGLPSSTLVQDAADEAVDDIEVYEQKFGTPRAGGLFRRQAGRLGRVAEIRGAS